ncbi:MAG: ABC transporter permease [Planctomycetota bacterium]|nr:ABC transporter permease [Planctomycetota bacterium]
MNLSRIVQEGIDTLVAHKLRTFFMMLGTILGIASLMVVLAIGKATRQEVMKRVNAFGTRLVKVNAGGGKGYTKPQAGVTTLRLEDAEAIRSSITGWDIVTSVSQRHGIPMKAGNFQTTADVFAVDSDWHEAMDWPAQEGDAIAPEDLATMAHVCVLGTRPAKDLFGDENPVGSDIHIGNIRFYVKGVLTHHSASPGGDDENNRAVIPLTTGLRRVFNQNHLTYIRVRMKNSGNVPIAAEQIRQLLHDRHHITPPQTDDFSIVTTAEVADAARGISGTLTVLLIALAGISLLIGGVVMMNILLISVTERKPEIGLRRALGATRGAIAGQFLAESMVITFIGAAIGALLGWGVSLLLPRYTSLKTVISWEPFALAVAFAMVVGLVFGVHPARRAARLNPAEALR